MESRFNKDDHRPVKSDIVQRMCLLVINTLCHRTYNWQILDQVARILRLESNIVWLSVWIYDEKKNAEDRDCVQTQTLFKIPFAY